MITGGKQEEEEEEEKRRVLAKTSWINSRGPTATDDPRRQWKVGLANVFEHRLSCISYS